jgi:hypothetical protein
MIAHMDAGAAADNLRQTAHPVSTRFQEGIVQEILWVI